MFGNLQKLVVESTSLQLWVKTKTLNTRVAAHSEYLLSTCQFNMASTTLPLIKNHCVTDIHGGSHEKDFFFGSEKNSDHDSIKISIYIMIFYNAF